MGNEFKYMVKWRTSRENEKDMTFCYYCNNYDELLSLKKEKESIKENIEVKIFKVEVTEIL